MSLINEVIKIETKYVILLLKNATFFFWQTTYLHSPVDSLYSEFLHILDWSVSRSIDLNLWGMVCSRGTWIAWMQGVAYRDLSPRYWHQIFLVLSWIWLARCGLFGDLAVLLTINDQWLESAQTRREDVAEDNRTVCSWLNGQIEWRKYSVALSVGKGVEILLYVRINMFIIPTRKKVTNLRGATNSILPSSNRVPASWWRLKYCPWV